MTITELINELSKLKEQFGEHECVIGINRFNGYSDIGEIETYPIEATFIQNINESFYKEMEVYANGYWQDNNDQIKYFIYVYP